MKLAAIYSVFDGEEHLPHSIKTIFDHVDLVIIVWQDISNWGEAYSPVTKLMTPEDFAGFDYNKIWLIKYDPILHMGPMMNERSKRNFGISVARDKGCTHFFHIDCDEYYEDFKGAKEMYLNSGCAGSVCRLHTYFKKPTLRLDRPEDYYVPFIHQLKPDTKSGASSYKFYCDPTRTINESDVIELPIFMHHFSWVRKDIGRKVRNSTARENIERGTLHKDYEDPAVAPGFHVRDYQRNLIEVPDIFGLNSIFALP